MQLAQPETLEARRSSEATGPQTNHLTRLELRDACDTHGSSVWCFLADRSQLAPVSSAARTHYIEFSWPETRLNRHPSDTHPVVCAKSSRRAHTNTTFTYPLLRSQLRCGVYTTPPSDRTSSLVLQGLGAALIDIRVTKSDAVKQAGDLVPLTPGCGL